MADQRRKKGTLVSYIEERSHTWGLRRTRLTEGRPLHGRFNISRRARFPACRACAVDWKWPVACHARYSNDFDGCRHRKHLAFSEHFAKRRRHYSSGQHMFRFLIKRRRLSRTLLGCNEVKKDNSRKPASKNASATEHPTSERRKCDCGDGSKLSKRCSISPLLACRKFLLIAA
jgi:hypothetical protein